MVEKQDARYMANTKEIPDVELIRDSSGDAVGVIANFPGIGSREIRDKQFVDYVCTGHLPTKDDTSGGTDTVASGITVVSDSGSGAVSWTEIQAGDYSTTFSTDVLETQSDTTDLDTDAEKPSESVDHPKHYNSHPSGIECIEIARCYDFDIGNAIKYLWRHGLKHENGKCDLDKAIEDLKKARWYIDDYIGVLEKKRNLTEPLQ